MDSDKLHALVRLNEQRAAQAPKQYRARIIGMIVLGYAYLLLITIVALAPVVGIIALGIASRGRGVFNIFVLQIFAVGLALSYLIARSLFVRFPRFPGTRVKRAAAPALFAEIDRLRAVLGSPPIHSVLLTDELNAAAGQRPRLGVFGWYQNSLLLGYPLMCALRPAEFSSVVAHEMGHLGGRHGRFSTWAYRVKSTWVGLYERLEKQKDLGKMSKALIVPFTRWYLERFAALCAPIDRQQEFYADRYAAEAATPEIAIRSLLRIRVASATLELAEGVELVRRRLQGQWLGGLSAFSEMTQSLSAKAADSDAGRKEITCALAVPPDEFSTHPTLQQRIEALRALAAPTAPVRAIPDGRTAMEFLAEGAESATSSAAEHFLAGTASALTESVGGQWAAAQEKYLAEHVPLYEKHEAEVLAAAAAIQDKPLAEWADLVPNPMGHYYALKFINRALEAREFLSQYFAENPTHSDAAGMQLILWGEELAEGGEDRASQMTAAILPGRLHDDLLCSYMIGHFVLKDSVADARSWFERSRAYEYVKERAHIERSTVRKDSSFTKAALPEEIAKILRDVVESVSTIERAWVVQRVLAYLPEVPQHLVILRFRHPWNAQRTVQAEAALLDQLNDQVTLGGNLIYRNEKRSPPKAAIRNAKAAAGEPWYIREPAKR